MSEPDSTGPRPIPQPNLNLDPARERMLREYEREQEERRRNASKSSGGGGMSAGKRAEQVILLLLGAVIFGALQWSGWIFQERGYLAAIMGQVLAPSKDNLTERLRLEYPLPPEEGIPLNKILVNWDLFPESIVPKAVTVNRETAYKLVENGRSIGSTTLRAGHTATVVKRVPNGLILAANPQMTLLAQVNPFDTSIGPALEAYYAKDLEQMKRRILAARVLARKVITRKPEKGDPRVMANGYSDPAAMMFQPVNAFILDVGIPGRRLEDVVYWGYLGKNRFDGQLYDEVAVFFKVSTLHGPSYHVLHCRLQDKVVKQWTDPSLPDMEEPQ